MLIHMDVLLKYVASPWRAAGNERLSRLKAYTYSFIHSLDEETYLKWENTLVQMASVAKPESL